MIYYSVVILCLLYFLLNLYLKYRAKKHSNKFVEKAIKKIGLLNLIKLKRQGWAITFFRTEKSIVTLNNSFINKKNWFQIFNSECSGVADPFLIKEKEKYYLFFEYEYKKTKNKGADIAYAVSTNGIDWVFKQKILQENFHQSFPYVFKKNDEFYMLPESYQSKQVRLYKAINFPNKWELDAILYEGIELVDTVFIEVDSVFYWFTTDLKNDTLELYYSLGLKEKWIKHPESPISKLPKNNRNAGAIIQENNTIYRVAQDATKGYGSGINLYEINTISKNHFNEKEVKNALFFKESDKIKDAIHHISVLKEKNNHLIALDGANFGIQKITL